ncbi:MAG: phosphatidate cytidylyltransferase, partial [Eubacterium sp.]|nr:phosphatidate cytidylyltransferase [Eubacterium sp.]
MVKRLITAAIGIPIGIFVLYLNNKDLMAGVTAILSVVAVYEILSARKYIAHKAVALTAMVFSFILPLAFCYDKIRGGVVVIAFLFLMLMFCAMLVNHKNVSFEEVGLVALAAICIPLSISTLAFFMFRYEKYGVFFIVYTLVTTWMADGGAYF